jgi:glycine/D-amino acid oxidase-like deaminating enzyme
VYCPRNLVPTLLAGSYRHDRAGHWLAQCGPVVARPQLEGDERADVAIVGGGYAGLWTAWALAEADPGLRLAVIEAETCGAGPSGRNAGFVNGFWHRADLLSERFGDRAALAACAAAAESVDAIGDWAGSRGLDIGWRRGGHLKVSTSPAQDGAWEAAVAACARIGRGDEYAAVDAAETRRRCDSPLFRGGAWMPGAATVQPAKLALALRAAVLERGVAIYERSRARAIRAGRGDEIVIETDAGARVRAPSAVLAINAATAGIRPLRSRLAVASTHMILTEPVGEVLADLGWTGGEAISTARRHLHYFRVTDDGRIAFGGAGGRLAYGARLGGRVELDVAAAAELRSEIARFFPGLHGRRIDAAWGGPVDVSPIHLPCLGSLASERIHYVCGFTGNGVGPAHLCGRALADLVLDRRTELTGLALVEPAQPPVPPEPLRWLGGNAVRAALRRKEGREDRGLPGGALSELVIEVPRRLGIHLGR